MNPVARFFLSALVALVLGAVAVWVGERVVLRLFAVVKASRPRPEQDRPADDSPLRGGSWIGRLERLAVFATLLAGYPEGIALALAVKGLARYPELRATQTPAAEGFIIGTFASVLFAAACAGVAIGLMRLW